MILTEEQRQALKYRKSLGDSTWHWPDGKDGWPKVHYSFGDGKCKSSAYNFLKFINYLFF